MLVCRRLLAFCCRHWRSERCARDDVASPVIQFQQNGGLQLRTDAALPPFIESVWIYFLNWAANLASVTADIHEIRRKWPTPTALLRFLLSILFVRKIFAHIYWDRLLEAAWNRTHNLDPSDFLVGHSGWYTVLWKYFGLARIHARGFWLHGMDTESCWSSELEEC